MKVIDLLNKIANEEEVPKKIKLGSFTTGELVEESDYLDYEMLWEDVDGGKHTYWLFDKPTYNDKLNEEVEIIEEDKKIEKLDLALLGQHNNWIQKYNTEKKEFESLGEEINPYIIDTIRENTIAFQKKINEIIDYLEEKE